MSIPKKCKDAWEHQFSHCDSNTDVNKLDALFFSNKADFTKAALQKRYSVSSTSHTSMKTLM